jgi:hypothetical protein
MEVRFQKNFGLPDGSDLVLTGLISGGKRNVEKNENPANENFANFLVGFSRYGWRIR